MIPSRYIIFVTFGKFKVNDPDVCISLLWLMIHTVFQLVTFQFTTGFMKPILTSINYGIRKRVTLASSRIEYHGERNCC